MVLTSALNQIEAIEKACDNLNIPYDAYEMYTVYYGADDRGRYLWVQDLTNSNESKKYYYD